jgi:TPR repeat protein
MRRTWVWILAAVGAASLAVLVASLLLPGLEELSWAAGTGSFVLAAAALALAWPSRTLPSPAPAPPSAPANTPVDNRAGDVHGTAVQAGAIHGPVTVNSLPGPAVSPVPGWVKVALPAHQADAHELGVHSALPGPEGEGLPPYVVRDVDGELDRRLAAAADSPRGGLVLVTGSSTAGKTRALAQALARTLPEQMLVAPPEDADLRPLPAWLQARAAQAPQGWVVWLDDVDRHLSVSGLTPALVAELGQAGAVVAATIRSERLKDLRPSATEHDYAVEGTGYAVLKTPPIVVERRWSPPERERARASGDDRLVQAADDERFGVAEQLAAGPVLEPVWLGGPDGGHPRGYALVAAAVGLAAAGVSSALTREQLQTAHTAYLPDPPPLPEDADEAWAWATRPRSGLAGLLVPADHEGHRWRAFDYLTPPGPLPKALWHAALATATDGERFDVGLTAHHAEQADIAEKAWRPLTDRGDAHAMVHFGILLAEAGRVEEAESWFRRAAHQDDTGGMLNLGILLAKAGRTEEAETWYRQAIDQGSISAMSNLGNLLEERGKKGEAETWYRQAAQQSHTDAMSNLGVLLAKAGRVEEAEGWFRRAIDQGSIGAMSNLGNLLKLAGRVEEAEGWFRRAIDQGSIGAMVLLGALLLEAGRKEKAEGWFRRAAEQGHTHAMVLCGVLLLEAGRKEEAEDWYRRAAEQGHTHATNDLGVLLAKAGRVEEAETWYRQAAQQGDTVAMSNLGNLLARAGRTEEAETWYRQAVDQGSASALFNLGNLLEKAGRTEEAETWYRQAADQDDTHAMIHLANLLEAVGQVEEAKAWRQRAQDAEGTE